ncbi:MAG: DNA methyltransferase [Planctomycetota bacterium]
MMAQLHFFDIDAPERKPTVDVSSTFAGNARLPVHRWFRYSAGFSATWAENLIRETGARSVLDPFAGSGTTLLAAEDAGADAVGVEAHPFIFRVASAKLLRHSDVRDYLAKIHEIREEAELREGHVAEYPPLVQKCFSQHSLEQLDRLRAALEQTRDDSAAWQLAWLTMVSILRPSSHVGTAQWQYVLPRKEKKRVAEPFAAFDSMVNTFAGDMRASQPPGRSSAQVLLGDARSLTGVPDGFAQLVVTSPPYPNNYDYADATRLEMSFFKEINGWGDLQGAVRQFLVRACSQHVPERSVNARELLESKELRPICDEITRVHDELATIRETKGGKKTYHLMITCYFYDLAQVWFALRRTCTPGARVCFVVGDSAPYGVYVPVMEWLGRLALASGFRTYRFERTRDRNVKWKNRKHRVPLCEGRLWVEG